MNRCNKFHFPCAFPPYTSGSTGPTGPGVSSTINNAFFIQPTSITVTAKAPIPFATTVSINGTAITSPTPGDIIINELGTYLANYYLTGNSPPGTSISMNLKLNGTDLVGSGFFVNNNPAGAVIGYSLLTITSIPSTLQLVPFYSTNVTGANVDSTYPVASLAITKLS